MPRSTHAQKVERLNAAHGWLARGSSRAEAATALSREFGISRRQAYRYLDEAQGMRRRLPAAEATVAVTLKIPARVVRDLRAHAASSGLTLGEIVARAVSAFLATAGEHG